MHKQNTLIYVTCAYHVSQNPMWLGCIKFTIKSLIIGGQKHIIGVKVLALHMDQDLGSIPGTECGPVILVRSDPWANFHE